MKSSKPAIDNISLWSRNQVLFRKKLIKITNINVQPKQQYKCKNVKKPYFKKGALTTHRKKAHNISNNITKNEFMAIFTNNELDNNNKNNEVEKLEVEHAKNQELVDNEKKLKIMLVMKITVNFYTSILSLVSVVTKETKNSVLLWSPATKFMPEMQKKLWFQNL